MTRRCLRAALAAALHALIAAVARERPLALFVDDLHRADEASLGVLGRLAHEARHLRLLLAFAVRTRRRSDQRERRARDRAVLDFRSR